MKVSVEQYHFDDGKPGDVQRCAVALAIADALSERGIFAEVLSTVHHAAIRPRDQRFQNVSAAYPAEVGDFILKFDDRVFSDKPRRWWNPWSWDNITFKPFTFELNNAYLDGISPWPMKELTTFLGCGDHPCIFERPKGMGTNGGCRCFKYLEDPAVVTRVRRAAMRLAQKAKMLDDFIRDVQNVPHRSRTFDEKELIRKYMEKFG